MEQSSDYSYSEIYEYFKLKDHEHNCKWYGEEKAKKMLWAPHGYEHQYKGVYAKQ